MRRSIVIIIIVVAAFSLGFSTFYTVSIIDGDNPDNKREWVIIRKTRGIDRFYASLLPDLHIIERGDRIAFADPRVHDTGLKQRELLVRRVIGLPGDIVSISAKKVSVNGKVLNEWYPLFFEYRLSVEAGFDEDLLKNKSIYHIDTISTGRAYNISTDPETAAALASEQGVVNIRQVSINKGEMVMDYFPKDPHFLWNKDYFGPVAIPQQDVTIMLNYRNAGAYRKIIDVYENKELLVSQSEIRINNQVSDKYVFELDYYFVMSDNRDGGIDSRHFGFLPQTKIIGKVVF